MCKGPPVCKDPKWILPRGRSRPDLVGGGSGTLPVGEDMGVTVVVTVRQRLKIQNELKHIYLYLLLQTNVFSACLLYRVLS